MHARVISRPVYLFALLFFSGLKVALAFTAATALAKAADLDTTGIAAQPSTQPRTNAGSVGTLDLLKKQAQANGTMRIIVRLNVAFVPEGGLTVTEAVQQRNEIARLQTVVLEKVPSLYKKPESIKRFAYSPFMTLEVGAAELEALAGLAEITSIEEDRILAPAIGFEAVTPESK